MTVVRPGAALIAAATLLAGCADLSRRTAAGGAAGDACRQIESLYVTSQRSAFSLDFPEAERRLREITSRYDSDPGLAACRGGVTEALAYAELGLTLSSQRKFRLAEAAFADAEAALGRRAAAAEDPDRLAVERGRIEALRAQHALNLRDYETAERAGREAVALLAPQDDDPLADFGALVELSAEDRGRRLSGLSGLYSRSAALARLGRAEEARATLDEALDVASALPGATGALRSRLLVESALIELFAGRPGAAATPAREAAEQLAVELPDTPLAARARLVEATALASARRREAAFSAFDRAFAAYGDSPAALQFESVWPYFKLAIESEAAGLIDEATMTSGVFEAAQLIRSASAASDIAQNAAQFEAGDDAAARAVREWRAAQDQLFLLSSALSRRDLQEYERESLNRRFVEAAEAEARLRARRDELAPDFAAAIERPASLEEVQAALEPDEALLQVMLGQPRSLLILVEPDDVTVRTTRIDGVTAGAIVQILRGATRPGPGGLYQGFNVGGAHLVFQELLGDLGPRIAEGPKVFVVATGALQGLPLEVLVASDPAPLAGELARGDYRGVDWLGARTAFSYLPSARNLVDLRQSGGASQATGRVLGFGDYDPGADGAAAIDARRRAACAAEADIIRRLPRLPGTGAELARIEAAFDGQGVETLTGSAFTESALKRLSAEGALADYRVLHFATHGLLWPTVDCFDPALTASVAPGEGEDGLIESGEIRALDLDAQLVVLSACESTDVEIADAGENLSGLARAFFGAGARSVLASHWLVDDEAAVGLMGAFYERLGADPTTPFVEALRAAQATLRDSPETSHPVFWAPFVVIGDGRLALGAG